MNKELIDKCKQKPTLEFLEELRQRARVYGWCGDYEEIRDFVKELYTQAGYTLSPVDLLEYEICPIHDIVEVEGFCPECKLLSQQLQEKWNTEHKSNA